MSQPQKPFKIILIGDNCIDRYEYVNVDRISPEAPVPVCSINHSIEKVGMASNVKKNLEKLGCEIVFFSGEPSIKTRIVDIRSKQQIIRLDQDVKGVAFCCDFLSNIDVDAIVISDYNKGVVSEETIKYIDEHINCPIFIDTKKRDLSFIKNAYVKINETEYDNLISHPDNLIVTRGTKPVIYDEEEFDVNTQEVIDVCGAGDTFLSALTYKYLESGDIKLAIKFAIKASSITVRHTGVYAPTIGEIEWGN